MGFRARRRGDIPRNKSTSGRIGTPHDQHVDLKCSVSAVEGDMRGIILVLGGAGCDRIVVASGEGSLIVCKTQNGSKDQYAKSHLKPLTLGARKDLHSRPLGPSV